VIDLSTGKLAEVLYNSDSAATLERGQPGVNHRMTFVLSAPDPPRERPRSGQ